MNLSDKLAATATLVAKMTEAGVRVGVVSIYDGHEDVHLVIHGDEASMVDAANVLDADSGIVKVGDIHAPRLLVHGTAGGLDITIGSTPQKGLSS